MTDRLVDGFNFLGRSPQWFALVSSQARSWSHLHNFPSNELRIPLLSGIEGLGFGRFRLSYFFTLL